jgi:TonB family protein
VRVEREEDVSIGGEAHRCYVVLATYHAGIDGGAAPAVTLWIDERSQIILRRRATAGLRIPRLDQAAEATVDFTLTELALSPQFAGDEFTFVPPKGSSPQTEDMPAAGTQASANAADARPSAAPSRAPGNDVISPPTIFSRAEPAYSREATELRLEGMVPLSIIVQSDGTPTAIVVTKSLGFGLDEAAIDAVRKWRFNPGQKNGESVPVKATVEVNFRFLPSEDGWFVTSAGFDVPEGASVPHLRNAVFPRKPKSGQPCSVTVLLAVDRQGKPGDIRIQAESDRKCEPELVAAIRKWKFEPATKDGVPVETSMIVEFSQ